MADRVTVIGWDGSPLSAAGRAALDAATLVAGGQALLQRLPIPQTAERMALGSTELVARRIAEHRGAAVVVADGDPGFFGVVRTLRRPEFGLELEVLPAVSSVAAAFARVGMPWDDARVVSTYGRAALRRCVNVCRAHSKVAVLTAPGAGPTELALMLRDVHRTFVVCEALGTPEEEVTVLTSDRVADHVWREPNVVLVVGGGGVLGGTQTGSGWLAGAALDFPSGGRGWAEPHGPAADRPALAGLAAGVGAGPAGGVNGRSAPADAPGAPVAAHHGAAAGSPSGMTGVSRMPGHAASDALSAEVRALLLARIGPRIGDLIWDVGPADSGLAIEVGRFGAAVVAVDPDAEACARLSAEARRAGVEVQVSGGVLPGVLAELPDPDVVLVRSGNRAVLQACLSRRPERMIAVPAALQEVEEARRAFGEVGYRMEGVLLQSAALEHAGAPGPAGHLLAPGRPSFVLWGQRP